MTRHDTFKVIAALCVVLAACSGDDDAAPAAECPDGADAGATSSCECESGDRGFQRCRSDGTLSACDCEGGAGSGGSGGSGTGTRDSGTSGTGDSGSGGSSGAGDSGSGGSGGSGAAGDEDGGT